MTSEFIDERLKKIADSIPGYDFYELAELAKNDPEEFERRRRQFLEAEIAKYPENCQEKDKQFMELLLQRHDPEMDVEESIVRAVIAPLRRNGDLNSACRDLVSIGTEQIKKEMDSVIQITNEKGREMKEIHSSLEAVADEVKANTEMIKENSKAMNEVEIGLAKIESGQISDAKKH